MRKRNYTVTIRMNKEEYNLLQSKVKESGRTQQEVIIKAIADYLTENFSQLLISANCPHLAASKKLAPYNIK